MSYCNHSEKYCNKDNTYNIINLVNFVVQNIGEYKTNKQYKMNPRNQKFSYNDIRTKMIKEININRLQNNGYWDNMIRKSSFSELQKLRQRILDSKKIKVENEMKTEFQTVVIKQEPNDEIQNKMGEIDNIKKESDDNEETENKAFIQIDNINNEEIEYKESKIDDIKQFPPKSKDTTIDNKHKMEEIEYHESEQTDDIEEVELSSTDNEQKMKEIEYPSLQNDDMEVESSTVDHKQKKAIEYHESDQIDDMEGVEFPSIDNTSDMEDVLLHFRFKEQDTRYANFIKARELYNEMFNDPQIERLQDGKHWSVEIDNLNYDYLPVNFKLKMHELRQWTYNMKNSGKHQEINIDDNEEKLQIEYSQADVEYNLQTDDNKETLKIISESERTQIKEIEKEIEIIFPEIDNINEMETILSNFKIKDEDRYKDSIQNFIKYHNEFNHILESDYKSLEDENHWLNSIDALSYQYLPDNYKTKLIEFYENDLEKKKKQQIDQEISDSKPNLLSSISDYTLDLLGYEENKQKRKLPEDFTESENIKKKRRELYRRNPKRASRKKPILIKPGFNNIVNDIITDIDNIIKQYKKTMDNSLEDYSEQFKKIRNLIHDKYDNVLHKENFLDLLYDYWVLATPKSDLINKYKSEILVNDVGKLIETFAIDGDTKFSF